MMIGIGEGGQSIEGQACSGKWNEEKGGDVELHVGGWKMKY